MVCYLCQGLIAPEFAGIDLGLAEKMAIRALAAATSGEAVQVAARVREVGDLGLAAEQLLVAEDREPVLTVNEVVARCSTSPGPRGPGHRGASWS